MREFPYEKLSISVKAAFLSFCLFVFYLTVISGSVIHFVRIGGKMREDVKIILNIQLTTMLLRVSVRSARGREGGDEQLALRTSPAS